MTTMTADLGSRDVKRRDQPAEVREILGVIHEIKAVRKVLIATVISRRQGRPKLHDLFC